jgi:glycosyltransferase involved in cell wall biosynthesis
MRICMVAYTIYLMDSRVRREAESLVDRGDSVEFICLKDDNKGKKPTNTGVTLLQVPFARYRGSNRIKYFGSYFLFFISSFIILSINYIKKPYDIVQVHTMPDFMVFTSIFPKLFGAKIILDVHDLMPELCQSKFHLAKTHWFIKFVTWVERLSIAFADGAIAVHKTHLDALVSHGNTPEKFIILINLPDPKVISFDNASINHKHEEFLLVYHGLVAKRNGLEIAIRAVKSLTQDIKNIKFLVIGEGDDAERLIKLVDQLDLCDHVTIRNGYIQLETLVPIIRNADLGVVPILYDEFTRYMLPVKLLEYVALKVPVVCARTETISAYFDETIVEFFTPGNIEELAEKIKFLYSSPEKRMEMSKNSDKFNNLYNWTQQKQIYYQFVNNLHKKGNSKG